MSDNEGLVRPTIPGKEFDTAESKLAEVELFIIKARSAAAQGPNDVPYKVCTRNVKTQKVLL